MERECGAAVKAEGARAVVPFRPLKLGSSLLFVGAWAAVSTFDVANVAISQERDMRAVSDAMSWVSGALSVMVIVSIALTARSWRRASHSATGYAIAGATGSVAGAYLSQHPEETSFIASLPSQAMAHLLMAGLFALVGYFCWKPNGRLLNEMILDSDFGPSVHLKASVGNAVGSLAFVQAWEVESFGNGELVLLFRINEPLTDGMSELLDIATTEIMADFPSLSCIDHKVAGPTLPPRVDTGPESA